MFPFTIATKGIMVTLQPYSLWMKKLPNFIPVSPLNLSNNLLNMNLTTIPCREWMGKPQSKGVADTLSVKQSILLMKITTPGRVES